MAIDPIPEAIVTHVTRGRARLRLPALRGRAVLFHQLGQALAEHPQVDEVRVNPRTAGLLLLHRGALDPILAFAREKALFGIVRRAEHAPMRRIEAAIVEMDRRLARETHGAFSLGTATFVGLVSAGLYQLQKGKFLPAGMTLFSYALDVMQREANREGPALQTRAGGVSVP